jgi:hypothetical protein
MSRHTVRKQDITIAYGYDNMMPPPMGGYFFQVTDEKAVDEQKNPEGIIVNEGFIRGISKNRMIELMTEHGVKDHHHLTLVALDLPL